MMDEKAVPLARLFYGKLRLERCNLPDVDCHTVLFFVVI